MEPNQERYLFEDSILSTINGNLCHGKDLALDRIVFVYKIHSKGNTSKEEYMRMLAGVAHFTDPNFFHILDMDSNDHGVFAVMETRPGSSLLELIKSHSLHLQFKDIIQLVVELGKSMQDALEERIRGYSVTAENIWLSEKHAMIINYWTEGEKQQRGALGLMNLLYQLLSRSAIIPGSFQEMETELLTALQDQSAEEKEIVLRLMKRTYAGLDSVSTIILELSTLFRQPMRELGYDETKEQPEPISELPTEASPRKRRPMNRKWATAAIILVLLLAGSFAYSLGPKEEASTLKQQENQAESKPAPIQKSMQPQEEPPEQQPDSPQAEEAGVAEDPTQLEQMESTPSSPEVQDSLTSQDKSTVPNLVGLTREEAERVALAQGLRYQFFLEANEQAAGIVFNQSLQAGTEVGKGAQIQFWVSKGPQ